ncbi:peroxiredoxin [Lacrimispora algidixylanolytica]|uniref:thioredoxin-dependent peroxiredoxin n=1 Tax=Lacrimispora algidixylanolytica TaxID=94868 RepID=A0A419T0Q9_9FIRM|nr:peroxiredoxin [Lacrimispora algidixylanolytica]RKD31144.1 hypothetical protein BET01_04625 [Lacrimispora algidixylanolytica]
MIETGTKAPAFSLPDQNGLMHTLEEYKGRKVILYFYPKDNTPGCTKQACNFGELYPQFQEKGAVVRTTYLIDEDGVIVQAFGKVKAEENPAQMLAHL